MNGRQDPLDSGRQLFAAWEAGHDPESLDAAISVLGQALAAPLPPPEAWPLLSWELGKALSARIGLRPDADDTNRLIEVLGDLIGVADQPGLRQKRGQALMKRHRRTSSAADLDAAIADFDAAIADFDAAIVALGEDESGQMYEVALDLSWALESRFDVRQGRDNRVVTYWDEGEGVPLISGPPDLVRPIFVLDNLLDASGWQQAHRAPPPPELAWRMKRNLANLLRKFAAATVGIRSPEARAGDAARAIELLLQARNEMPPDSNEAGTVLVSLLAALQNFPEPDPRSRDELVTALEDSLPTAPPGQADLIRLNLAELRIAQNRVAEGVSLYRALISPGGSGAESMGVRLLAADRWAFSALRRAAWEEVLDAHAVATSLTAQLRASSADWDDRYRWSQKTARVATAAGTALVRLGRPTEAAAALQAGRALELTERLGSRAISGAQRTGTSICLLSTPGGTDALHRTKGADWSTVPLPGLAPDALLDQTKTYVNAFDAYRRRPSSSVESWLVELERMVKFLGAGLRPLRQVLPAGDVTIVPMGLLSILPVGTAFLDTSPTRGVSIVPTLARRPAVTTV
ncbi:MAG: hypothetical protein ABI345_05785, partial [Jatrophihabitans sp.]